MAGASASCGESLFPVLDSLAGPYRRRESAEATPRPIACSERNAAPQLGDVPIRQVEVGEIVPVGFNPTRHVKAQRGSWRAATSYGCPVEKAGLSSRNVSEKGGWRTRCSLNKSTTRSHSCGGEIRSSSRREPQTSVRVRDIVRPPIDVPVAVAAEKIRNVVLTYTSEKTEAKGRRTGKDVRPELDTLNAQAEALRRTVDGLSNEAQRFLLANAGQSWPPSPMIETRSCVATLFEGLGGERSVVAQLSHYRASRANSSRARYVQKAQQEREGLRNSTPSAVRTRIRVVRVQRQFRFSAGMSDGATANALYR